LNATTKFAGYKTGGLKPAEFVTSQKLLFLCGGVESMVQMLILSSTRPISFYTRVSGFFASVFSLETAFGFYPVANGVWTLGGVRV
jgi:hypothetical protein